MFSFLDVVSARCTGLETSLRGRKGSERGNWQSSCRSSDESSHETQPRHWPKTKKTAGASSRDLKALGSGQMCFRLRLVEAMISRMWPQTWILVAVNMSMRWRLQSPEYPDSQPLMVPLATRPYRRLLRVPLSRLRSIQIHPLRAAHHQVLGLQRDEMQRTSPGPVESRCPHHESGTPLGLKAEQVRIRKEPLPNLREEQAVQMPPQPYANGLPPSPDVPLSGVTGPPARCSGNAGHAEDTTHRLGGPWNICTSLPGKSHKLSEMCWR